MRKGSKKPESREDYIKRARSMPKSELEAETRRLMPTTTPLDITKEFFQGSDQKGVRVKAYKIIEDDETIKSYAFSMSAAVMSILGLDVEDVTNDMTREAGLLMALLLEAYGEEPR